MIYLTKKLDKMHIDNGDGTSKCGKRFLGNNYADEFILNFYGVWEDKYEVLPSRGICEECILKAEEECNY